MRLQSKLWMWACQAFAPCWHAVVQVNWCQCVPRISLSMKLLSRCGPMPGQSRRTITSVQQHSEHWQPWHGPASPLMQVSAV